MRTGDRRAARRGLAAGGAGADRGVLRGAGAGPGAGDRHLPVHLDPGLWPGTLDAGQASAARGHRGGRRRGVQRAVLLVLPAVLRRRSRRPLPSAPQLFDLRGVAFAAWTLAAFSIGALASLLIRRVVPAIAATLAAYAGLAFAAGLYLRQHYRRRWSPTAPTCLVLRGSSASGRPGRTVSPRPADQRDAPGLRPAASDRTEPPGIGQPSALPSTATRSGSATSQPAGSGRSSGSRAAGYSPCPCCSSPRPSG